MDEKDILDILITVGIFAFSAIIGLVSEKNKKRKAAPQPAVSPAQSPAVARPVRPVRSARPIAAQAAAAAAAGVKPAAPHKMEGSDYHFDASEEGGCSIPDKHPAPEPLTPMQPVAEDPDQGLLSDDERRDLLRTIIIGEALARKF